MLNEAIQRELDKAEAARSGGNEGKARVCARRAAGWAVQTFLNGQGVDLGTPDVLRHFRYLLEDENLPPKQREILEHLVHPKVRPNLEEDSYYPLDVDLIAEARQLIALLFPETKTDG